MSNHISIIKKYLRDHKADPTFGQGLPFITISREPGAGGHTLAREILRKVEERFSGDFSEGWELFDQKLCALIAQDNALGMSFDALVSEDYRSEISQVVDEMIHQRASRYVAYKRIFEVVRLLASIGKCVIVGRAGMCVTADMQMGVSIRLVANPETCLKNMMQLMEVGEAEAAKAIRQQQRDRRRLVHDFFDREITDPLLYDAVFSTERMTISEIAQITVEIMVRKMARFPQAFARMI